MFIKRLIQTAIEKKQHGEEGNILLLVVGASLVVMLVAGIS